MMHRKTKLLYSISEYLSIGVQMTVGSAIASKAHRQFKGESTQHMASVQNREEIQDSSLKMRLSFIAINRFKYFKVKIL